MSTAAPIFSPSKPDLRTLLNQVQTDVGIDLNCHQVGKLVSFNAALQTASVQLQMLAVRPDGTQVPYPVLTDCPVFIYAGGGAAITLPYAAGDPCLVLFNDRDLDNWWATGNVVAPNSSRTHSLSDGLVLVGFRNKSNPIADYLTGDMEFRFLTVKISMTSGGIWLSAPDTTATGNLSAGTGATGMFTSADGSLITVVGGIITNIDDST